MGGGQSVKKNVLHCPQSAENFFTALSVPPTLPHLYTPNTRLYLQTIVGGHNQLFYFKSIYFLGKSKGLVSI
jgi:hypothetical protein